MIDDLFFEKELRRRIRSGVEANLSNLHITFNCGDSISPTTASVLQGFDEILDEYFYSLYGKDTDYDIIEKHTTDFINQFTDNNLKELFDKTEFTKEECDYMKLVQLTKNWDGNKYFFDAKFALTDILIRRKIIAEFNESSISLLTKLLHSNTLHLSHGSFAQKHFSKLLDNKLFGQETHKELEALIDEYTTYLFNEKINCGGYALKVDTRIYPTGENDAAHAVSSILNKFSFIRLLGNTKLQDDEYLVLYRTASGKNTGHHFIRVDSDGTVREKDGPHSPQLFEDWNMQLPDGQNFVDAIFAVKKEHQMFGYDSSLNYTSDGKDFEETVHSAIKNHKNYFTYHCQAFCLKSSNQSNIYVTSENGDIIADVLVVDDECVVDIKYGFDKFVENYMGKNKPIIKNGKLINYSEFKQSKTKRLDIENEK